MLNSLQGFHNGFRPPAPPPGTVIVSDEFQSVAPGRSTAHGATVANTIQNMGFPGMVVGDQHDFSSSPAEQFFQAAISSRVHDKETARSLISGLAEATAGNKIDSYSRELFDGLRFGEHNSVRNFSSGISKSNITETILFSSLDAFHSDDPTIRRMGENSLSNLALAYDLDINALVSEDTAVRHPARDALMQGLAGTVSETIDNSPVVADSRRRFSETVRAYEANNNSVVVAAGNNGGLRESLVKEGIEIPADFGDSLLAVDEVTSVGALQGSQIAEYSNRDEQVDIFANGDAGRDPVTGEAIQGTSFAAPRVAAVMASLHATHPNASSEEIEAMLKSEVSKRVETNDGETIFALKAPKSTRERFQTPAFGGPQQNSEMAGFFPFNLGQTILGLIQQIQQAFFPTAPVQLGGAGFSQPRLAIQPNVSLGSSIDFYAS